MKWLKYLVLFFNLIILKFAAFAQNANVILVLVDDQGYGDFSFNGNPLIKTPNVDKLASEGVCLDNFHVSPMSTPTRGQLLTGLDSFRNGAMNVSSGRTLLRPELKTMANVFRDAGYQTAIFGKWHLGDNYPYRPEDRGFNEAIWFPSSHINSVSDAWDNDYFDDTYIHNTKREKYKGYCTDIFFDKAIDWMKERADAGESFFTYLPLNSAHWPWFVPEEYRTRVRKAIEEKPEVVSHLNESGRNDLVSFLAMGLNVDDNMGKLARFLETSGLKENTIVVFLTDNGSTMGEHYYNANMRGSKTTLWEGGHRVPCIINAPCYIVDKPGEVKELCHVQDLFPTLCAMSGVKNVPEKLDGENLYPLINGEIDKLHDRMLMINYSRIPVVKVSYTTDNPAIPHKDGGAVMWGDWRLLENRELYNVKNDPLQNNDVASQNPEIVAKMRAQLYRWWNGVKKNALEIQNIVIGNDAENPVMLTACDWLDVFVDQQVHIRTGVNRNGVWNVYVDQSGEYEFELRRWPRDAGFGLREGAPSVTVTDGVYQKGLALPIRSCEMRVGTQLKERSVADSDKSVKFSFSLEKGQTTIQTWFRDDNGKDLCGAYYLYCVRK